jgi:excisionase family DNA binding protein
MDVHKITDVDEPHSHYQTTPHTALTRLAYSPSEAARVLGISRSKLYELITSGHVQVIKLGSRTLILHSELARFLGSLGVRARRGRPRKTSQKNRNEEALITA